MFCDYMKFLFEYLPDVLNSKIKNNKYIIGFHSNLIGFIIFCVNNNLFFSCKLLYNKIFRNKCCKRYLFL